VLPRRQVNHKLHLRIRPHLPSPAAQLICRSLAQPHPLPRKPRRSPQPPRRAPCLHRVKARKNQQLCFWNRTNLRHGPITNLLPALGRAAVDHVPVSPHHRTHQRRVRAAPHTGRHRRTRKAKRASGQKSLTRRRPHHQLQRAALHLFHFRRINKMPPRQDRWPRSQHLRRPGRWKAPVDLQGHSHLTAIPVILVPLMRI
jgi:hypothetical protein